MQLNINKKYRNVCEVVVRNNLCIGCGVCAGICPPKVLDMRFNNFGEYIPIEYREGCLSKCDMCFQVCPFWDKKENEDSLSSYSFKEEENIQYRNETGYYIKAFAGYCTNDSHRLNAASGGLATWFLSSLLDQGIVDRVVCVTPNNNPNKLFNFTILSKPEDVIKSAKSCYYPVEMSEIIKEILNVDARYAVIGLPCFLKGIRLAMLINHRLKSRIVALAGLVCGQTKSKFFAEYSCALGGGVPSLMTRVKFRIKDPKRPAHNYGFYFECDGEAVPSGTVFWADGMDKAWGRGYFKQNSCNYCDDIFAELADVVFMDGWLNRYKDDPKGTNLVLVRKASLLSIFKQGCGNNDIYLEDIPIEDIIQSQQAVVDIKRIGLAERLGMSKILRWTKVPKKRVSPSRISLYRFCQLFLERWLISASRKAFLRQRGQNGLKIFNRRIRPLLFLQKVVNYIQILALRIGIEI